MILKKNLAITTLQASCSGFYSIQGITSKDNVIYGNCEVRLYDRSTGLLVNKTNSNSDGTYGFRNLIQNKFLLIATDNTKMFNAVIQDNVVPK